MTRRLTIIPVLLIVFFIFGIVFSWFHFFPPWRDYSLFILVKVTIPEGYTLEDIADKFKPFKNFNQDNFFRITKDKEGYLFPDTYFLSGNETEEKIVKIMEENFKKKAGQINPKVLVIASLLEKESKITEERKIISGILWKRLKADMPLQVDAEPDTYLYKGLPPAPICNPGLDSIGAALNPVESKYWYYLHDKKGIIHYAKTFEEHKANKAKYLK
jgi:UPF0755 protein